MDRVIFRVEETPEGAYANTPLSDVTINTCTFSAGSSTITTAAAHGLSVGQKVRFTTTGTLPAAISVGTLYYVLTTATSTTLTIAATSTGSAIVMATTGTGIHTIHWADRKLSSKFDGPGSLGVYGVITDLSSAVATVTEQWLADGFVDEPYLVENLWDADVTFSVVEGTLPPGVTMTQPTPETVRISGTPTTVGAYTFTIRLERSGSMYDYITYLTINPAMTGDGGGGGVGGG